MELKILRVWQWLGGGGGEGLVVRKRGVHRCVMSARTICQEAEEETRRIFDVGGGG